MGRPISLKEFSAAEMFSKSGVQFSDLHSTLGTLVNKGYLIKEGNNFRLSASMNVDFNEFNVYDKPEFRRSDGERLVKNIKVYDVINYVSSLIKINNYKECWLEVYC